MTQNRGGGGSRSDAFARSLAVELIEMSDAELLEGQQPAEITAIGARLLESAKREAGKRRLAQARARTAVAAGVPDLGAPTVSAEEARAYLRLASKNLPLTLAARNVSEMSDANILTLYRQVLLLQSQNGPEGEVEGE